MDIKKIIVDEIKRMPVSRYRLSKETGVNEALLSRLVRGEAGVSLENAEKLLDYFGFVEIKKQPGDSSQTREAPNKKGGPRHRPDVVFLKKRRSGSQKAR